MGFFVLGLMNGLAQEIQPKVLDTVPSGIAYKGKLIKSLYWSDLEGEHILLVSTLGPYEESDQQSSDEKSMSLFVSQYLFEDGAYSKQWTVYDFEKQCPFDLYVGLLSEGIYVSDLDADGIAETTMVYKLMCTSDISPSRMKVLLFNKGKKMGLRGVMLSEFFEDRLSADFNPNLSKVSTKGLSEFETDLLNEGRYHNEDDFKGAAPAFLAYAKKLWLSHVDEHVNHSL